MEHEPDQKFEGFKIPDLGSTETPYYHVIPLETTNLRKPQTLEGAETVQGKEQVILCGSPRNQE